MGINSHLKIFVGYKLDKEQTNYVGYYDPDYPDDYNGVDIKLAKALYQSFDTEYDVMCGDYLYFGQELYESVDGRYTPWDFQEKFDIDYLDVISQKLYREILILYDMVIPEDWNLGTPQLHIFVHLT